jgi:hypothetical protein
VTGVSRPLSVLDSATNPPRWGRPVPHIDCDHSPTSRAVDVTGWSRVEAADGRLVGVEVKAAETVHRSDFAGLRHLQSRLGDRFHFGLVLYVGTTVASFGERLAAAPIDLLWQ